MLLGMEPFSSRGSGEMKRGKTAITFPGIPPFWVAAYSVTSRGTMLSLATPLKRGHYGRWAFESICVYGDNGGKPYNRASPVEMHPYSRYAGLPPEGEVFSPLSI